MEKISYYTEKGLKELREKLDHLKDVERPRASQAIGEARDKGDLSENAEYDAAKTVIAAGSDGEFTWGEVLLKWSGFESLFDHLSFLGTRVSESKPEPAPVTASLIAVEEALLKVYQNDDSNTLRFYGLSGNQVFIAELSPSIWQNAAEGDILLDVENITLGTQLVVTMMANGQLQIEYFDLDDGSILYSKVITL